MYYVVAFGTLCLLSSAFGFIAWFIHAIINIKRGYPVLFSEVLYSIFVSLVVIAFVSGNVIGLAYWSYVLCGQ